MADNDFRSYRGCGPSGRTYSNPLTSQNDPLAELARLIGQTDPYAERDADDAYQQSPADADMAASRPHWEDDNEFAPSEHADDHSVSASPSSGISSYSEAEEPNYEDEPNDDSRHSSASAARFSGFQDESFQDEAGAREWEETHPALPSGQLPNFLTPPPGAAEDEHEPAQEGDDAYHADDDGAPSHRRRGGLVAVIAVLGLAVVGTGGAFAYRVMFGGSALPTLPPIIRAASGPNKIVPSSSASQAANLAKTASADASEALVSREEQPVNVEPPKVGPRVVSTIPIIAGQSSSPPAAMASAQPGPAATPIAPAAPASGGAEPAAAASSVPSAVPMSAPAPSTEPRKIRTVTIREDQPSESPTGTAFPAPPVSRAAVSSARAGQRGATTAARWVSPPNGRNAPLSIVPGADGDAAARARAQAAPMAVASAMLGASSSGGYAVQVLSQHTETEVQASFRALQAKFPEQLGGRTPIIRRADLGAKGVYYRALVGPFASVREAASLCGSLKAAGGHCLVQRN